LLVFDALSFQMRTFNIKRRDDNPLNGKNPTITELIDYELFCGLKNLSTEKPMKEISAQELHDWQASGEKFQLIDVREPSEYEVSNIGAELMPLSTISARADHLSREIKVVVHCRSGARSATAIRELEEKFGFDNLYNLKGGILACEVLSANGRVVFHRKG
jgi:adenylyltransferase/sulfurtransferase